MGDRVGPVRVRISDGLILRRWNVPPSPRGHVLGDLAIGPRGDVFVTDSDDPALYRLRPGGDTLEALRHPLFHSLQGLAPAPDGRVLYLADYSHGMLRVDLETHEVTRLEDAPRSTALGCDGIAWDRGAIVGSEFVYVANSQWDKYGDDGVRRPSTRLTAPVDTAPVSRTQVW